MNRHYGLKVFPHSSLLSAWCLLQGVMLILYLCGFLCEPSMQLIMFSLYTGNKSGNGWAVVLLFVRLQFCCLIALLHFVANRDFFFLSFANLTYLCLCPLASGLLLLHVSLYYFVVCNQWDTSTSIVFLLLTFTWLQKMNVAFDTDHFERRLTRLMPPLGEGWT